MKINFTEAIREAYIDCARCVFRKEVYRDVVVFKQADLFALMVRELSYLVPILRTKRKQISRSDLTTHVFEAGHILAHGQERRTTVC